MEFETSFYLLISTSCQIIFIDFPSNLSFCKGCDIRQHPSMVSVLTREDKQLLFNVFSPLLCLIFLEIYFIVVLASTSVKGPTIVLIIDYDLLNSFSAIFLGYFTP